MCFCITYHVLHVGGCRGDITSVIIVPSDSQKTLIKRRPVLGGVHDSITRSLHSSVDPVCWNEHRGAGVRLGLYLHVRVLEIQAGSLGGGAAEDRDGEDAERDGPVHGGGMLVLLRRWNQSPVTGVTFIATDDQPVLLRPARL